MQIFCFFLKIFPLIFAFIGVCLQKLLLWNSNAYFLFLLFFYMHYLELYYNKLFLLAYLFINLIIYISIKSWIFICFGGFIIQINIIYFISQIVPALLIGNFFKLAPVSFWHAFTFKIEFLFTFTYLFNL